MSRAVWWRGVAEGSNNGMASLAMKLLLAPFAVLYGMALRVRALLYQGGILSIHKLPCPVISIGNITVGGTGKTPATMLVAKELQKRGYRVAVLSRGYGGSLEGQVAVVSDGESVLLGPEQAGDEPCLLAQTVPGLMVVIGSDRYQAGLVALERLKPDVLLLDDGFQHIRLHRDLNILLLDATRPFGNGWTLPLGMLRESRSAMRRADLALFTRCRLGQVISGLGLPCCCSEHCLTGFNLLETGNELPLERLQQGRVAAFAGIADPSAFFDGLQALGIQLVATLALPDHASYADDSLMLIERLAADAAADWLVTTAKDGVKLAGCNQTWSNKLVTARLELLLDDPDRLLQSALDKLLSSLR
ncbi:lipid-A-disaccharide kinase [Trichlorobacter thiogenes]|uniref:Tetraacyldisaccharide 4'-kinase n=1 Tax=Trichlorobacter thiogenes TaxID=115783 RepID=A0A1T4R3U8_9BACT|nr:tetraacyldisaccharide 4'-kinase [Trichlorobacter thiogenes]SKA10732.1 lipid-A-disaccharide kinase [Trichlorobacter thiogenes]